MTANDNKAYDHVVWSDFKLEDWIQEQIENGYRIVCGLRKDGDAITAELQCIDRHHAWYGWRLSAGSDTYLEAMHTLVYKHTIALQGDWDKCPQPQSRENQKRY